MYEYASPALLAKAGDTEVRAYLLRTAELLAREVGRDHGDVIAALRRAAG